MGEALVGRSGGVDSVTLWVPDWAVPVPDWPGFRMFGRESSVCKGWNPVRVPPRARVSLFRGLWASECAQAVHLRALRGPFLLVARTSSCVRVAVLLVICSWLGGSLTARPDAGWEGFAALAGFAVFDVTTVHGDVRDKCMTGYVLEGWHGQRQRRPEPYSLQRR